MAALAPRKTTFVAMGKVYEEHQQRFVEFREHLANFAQTAGIYSLTVECNVPNSIDLCYLGRRFRIIHEFDTTLESFHSRLVLFEADVFDDKMWNRRTHREMDALGNVRIPGEAVAFQATNISHDVQQMTLDMLSEAMEGLDIEQPALPR